MRPPSCHSPTRASHRPLVKFILLDDAVYSAEFRRRLENVADDLRDGLIGTALSKMADGARPFLDPAGADGEDEADTRIDFDAWPAQVAELTANADRHIVDVRAMLKSLHFRAARAEVLGERPELADDPRLKEEL